MADRLEVTKIFQDLVDHGHVTPTECMEELRFPGELPYSPSITTYGTNEAPYPSGGSYNAELGQRPQGDYV